MFLYSCAARSATLQAPARASHHLNRSTAMQLIIGTLLDVTTRPREYEGRTWDEHVAHVLDGHEVTDVTLQGPSRDGRDAGLSPLVVIEHKGERVALATYSRGGNQKRVYVTATALVDSDVIADALGLTSV